MTEKNNIVLFVILILLFGVFVLALTFYQQREQGAFEGQSTLALTPTGEPPISPEPEVQRWKKYANGTYNFSIDMPEGWYVQDYQKAYTSGGTLIAFSPNPLPCETCSYFYNGYFSVRIYNETSDPIYYSDFVKRKNAVGKSKEYRVVTINNLQGVAFANTLAFEQQGWVYELSLDTREGNADVTESAIFQKAAGSLQFTHLQFSN